MIHVLSMTRLTSSVGVCALGLMIAVSAVALAQNSPSAQAGQAPDPRVADLVQSGKLRVALGLGSPVLAIKDPKSGEARGPALDLARALATKIGVRLEAVEYPRPGAILQGVQNNEWDVTFLVADPDRSAEADFSPPYIAVMSMPDELLQIRPRLRHQLVQTRQPCGA